MPCSHLSFKISNKIISKFIFKYCTNYKNLVYFKLLLFILHSIGINIIIVYKISTQKIVIILYNILLDTEPSLIISRVGICLGV